MADQNKNMMALKDLLAFDPTANLAAAPSVAPMAQVAPQLSPTAQYINDMQTLLRGGIGKLSTGEKLGAVGQILQAAGSRGAADPGAVIQNVRQQQMQKLNAQYQIAQLQQKQQQDAQKRAFIDQYASTVPEDLQGLLANADVDTAFEIVKSRVAGNTQLFQLVDGPDGKKVAVYSHPSGKFITQETPFPNKMETAVVDQGVKKTLINKDTGEVISEFNVDDLTPARVARLNKQPASRSGGGGRGGKLNKPELIDVNGTPTLMQWDPTNQRYVRFNQPGISKTPRSGASDFTKRFTGLLQPKTNQPMFGK